MEIEIKTQKYGNIKTKIDNEDYKFIENHKIQVSKMKNDKYYILRDDKKYLHRLIMGEVPSNMVIDHINRNSLDNRKKNLRIATRSLNSINTDKRKFKDEDILYILLSPLSNNKLAKQYNCSNCLISNIRTGILYSSYFPEILRMQNSKARQNVYRV